MPELPEVETIVRGLRAPLVERTVTNARIRHRALYRRGSLTLRHLIDRKIESVERIGKNAMLRFSPSGLLVINLGMTGNLLVCRVDESPPGRNPKHLHVRIGLDHDLEIRYYDPRRFGHFYVAEQCDFATELNIGPDPFEADRRYLRAILEHRGAPIKALLLDQRILSGIGNIYADETLYHARVAPLNPGEAVARRAGTLLTSARAILHRAIEHGGSTLRDYRRHDGSRGAYQRFHAVYGREGSGCQRCGTAIRKIVVAGRGTHFCPRCQK